MFAVRSLNLEVVKIAGKGCLLSAIFCHAEVKTGISQRCLVNSFICCLAGKSTVAVRTIKTGITILNSVWSSEQYIHLCSGTSGKTDLGPLDAPCDTNMYYFYTLKRIEMFYSSISKLSQMQGEFYTCIPSGSTIL